jgi:hypothetical protein
MEKKKGLSVAEQMPLATVGTVLRSQPAEVPEIRVVGVSAVAPFLAAPQV